MNPLPVHTLRLVVDGHHCHCDELTAELVARKEPKRELLPETIRRRQVAAERRAEYLREVGRKEKSA